MVTKRKSGGWNRTFTVGGSKTPPEELFLADTELGTFRLKVNLQRGVATDFRIRKTPPVELEASDTGG